ncbi:MAG: radical SAM protein [Candidatus Woesearchaeota archaeon]|jgi:radical SAM superfamily enzyme YgiQ (UPF0313 family)|nr:radical SAM protein [Candidatus Woesearchaeota archaeon]
MSEAESKKLLLINPPWRLKEIYGKRVVAHGVFPPHGLISLAGYLREKGIELDLVDADPLGYSVEDIKRIIEEKKPDVVGLTVTTSTFKIAYDIAKAAKECNAIVVMGGVHPTTVPKEVLKYSEIDYVIMGEGEEAFFELMQNIDDKDKVKEIKNLAYKEDEKIVINERRAYTDNLDSFPMPAWDLLPIEKYRPYAGQPSQKLPFISIFTSRGCPFDCIYCETKIMCGKKARLHSAERVIEEISTLYNKFGVRNIMFFDDIFTLDRKRLMKICDYIIDNKLDLTWSCLGRVNCVDVEMLKKMKKAGCEIISYGVESGDPEVLEFYRRGTSLEQIRKAFRWTEEEGIQIRAFFMVGSPLPERDIRKSIRKTVDFAKELNPESMYISILTPFPGSEMYELFAEKGFVREMDWSDFTMFHKTIMKVPGITQEELAEILDKAYREYYLRPKYIFKMLRKLKSPKQFFSYLKASTAVFFS